MNFYVPVELFDAVLITLLGLIWKQYRAIWRHIIKLEKQQVKIMVMLHMNGFDVPDEGDTELFLKANNL